MPRSTEAIKVLVVDDHPVVRLGLRTMLESEGNITVTGTAASAKEALAEVQRQRPDVVLMGCGDAGRGRRGGSCGCARRESKLSLPGFKNLGGWECGDRCGAIPE